MKTWNYTVRLGKIVLMAVGACFLVYSAANLLKASPASEKDGLYELGSIHRGDVRITVSSTGSLAAVGTVNVGTQVSGTIEKVLVDFNDHVRKGQVLATLDQSLYRSALLEAEATVATAKAQIHQAEVDLDRNKALIEKNLISQESFLSFQTKFETARAALMAAEAAYQRAKTNLAYTFIRSPIDGTVIERSVEAGQTLAAALNAPTMFVIAEDLSRMQIEADVDESDIGQIKVGQSVAFDVGAYPNRKFSGTVVQVRLKPQIISNVVMYTVVVDANNPDGILLPGMTATVEFLVQEEKNALLVPDSALRVSLDRTAPSSSTTLPLNEPSNGSNRPTQIHVLSTEGKVRTIPVTVGISDGASTVVSGPDLAEGMSVIVGFQSQSAAAKGNLFSRLMPRPPQPSKRPGG